MVIVPRAAELKEQGRPREHTTAARARAAQALGSGACAPPMKRSAAFAKNPQIFPSSAEESPPPGVGWVACGPAAANAAAWAAAAAASAARSQASWMPYEGSESPVAARTCWAGPEGQNETRENVWREHTTRHERRPDARVVFPLRTTLVQCHNAKRNVLCCGSRRGEQRGWARTD